MQGFQGYGYNQVFVNNMDKIIRNINSNPGLEIEIITKCDVICACCPHNVKGICQKKPDSAQKVREMDLFVLRKLELKRGTKVRAKDTFALVNARLSNTSDIESICGDCEWKEKCLWLIPHDKSLLSG